MVHIESKISKRNSSEYDIYVNLENEKGGAVPIPRVVSSLKRQFSYIQIEGDGTTEAEQRKKSTDKPIAEEDQTKEIIDTENTVFINSKGEQIRKSKV